MSDRNVEVDLEKGLGVRLNHRSDIYLNLLQKGNFSINDVTKGRYAITQSDKDNIEVINRDTNIACVIPLSTLLLIAIEKDLFDEKGK